jgi:SAM-dependent methyltransferase
MYKKSARYYDALYHFKDYQAASTRLVEFMRHYHPNARTVLDVACGTGRHVELLRAADYEVEGLDINPDLLGLARSRSPGARFHQGDMIDFDIGRKYDVVMCLFSSIAYAKTSGNFAKAVASMGRHLAPGGLLIIEPYFTPEQFWVGRLNANYVDQPDLKIVWMFVPEKIGHNLSRIDIHYMVGTPQGVEEFRELHEHGLFTHQEYLDAFLALNLESHLDKAGLFNRGLYLAKAQLRSDPLPDRRA